MGIEKLQKAAQAAGVAMAAPDDESETRPADRLTDAWTYTGHRTRPTEKTQSPKTAAAPVVPQWTFWSLLTGKATA